MGIKPKPIAPIDDPDLVAEATLSAAGHRTRDLAVGGGGKLMTTLEAFTGPLLDRYMVWSGAKGQQPREPKPEGSPTNLFQPLHADAGAGRGARQLQGARLQLEYIGAAPPSARSNHRGGSRVAWGPAGTPCAGVRWAKL